jgi:acyl-CoA synthetase (AMP-forming)/AMP-acid ligase II
MSGAAAETRRQRSAYYIVTLGSSSMLDLNVRDEIVEAFLALAASRPGAPLIMSRTRTVSAQDVLDAATLFRGRVRASTLPRHSLIGMAVPNGPAFVAVLLALRMEGHPVLLLDPAAPYTQSARAASTLRAAAVVSAPSGWLTGVEVPDVDRRDEDSPFTSERVAVVKLTSGSTGNPRGVATPAVCLISDECNLAQSMSFAKDDRLLATLPFSHSYGFTTLVMTGIVRGLPLILPEDDQGGPFAALTVAHACGATVFPTVPAYLQALLAMRQPPEWPRTVRLVISAGAILAPEVAATFRRAYGRPVHTFYGSSECGGNSPTTRCHAVSSSSIESATPRAARSIARGSTE